MLRYNDFESPYQQYQILLVTSDFYARRVLITVHRANPNLGQQISASIPPPKAPCTRQSVQGLSEFVNRTLYRAKRANT